MSLRLPPIMRATTRGLMIDDDGIVPRAEWFPLDVLRSKVSPGFICDLERSIVNHG